MITALWALLALQTVSIKPNQSGAHASHWAVNSEKMLATNVTLLEVIERAYSVREYQISGGPDWLKSQRYDIQADSAALQSLLKDRFKLALHSEQKTVPVYALVVAKNGPKLQVLNNDGQSSVDTRHGFMTMRGPMSTIAEALSRNTDLPVVDKTGLTGAYKCELDWTPTNAQAGPPDPTGRTGPIGPDIFDAVQEQLGLKLVPQKAPIEVLIIDHIEKVPTAT